MWKKFKAFINKDVGNENEVKMYALIMRILLIISALYFVFRSISCFIMDFTLFGEISLIGMLISVGLFALTYRNKTFAVTVITIIMFTTFIGLDSYMFGLGTAVSQLIFVVIMIICAIDYLNNIHFKLAAVTLVLFYRIAIFTYLKSIPSYYVVTEAVNSLWQTVNMVAFSAMIVAITLISTSDFTQMRQKLTQYNTRLRDVAGKDPLTGLFNRRSAIEYINGKLDGYRKGHYTALTIVMADIDHFKIVNDTYGHDKGDEVLVSIADTMGQFMRDKGLASRWGGEEFVLIFVNNNGDEAYAHLINLQRELSARRFFFNGDEIKITLTYGLAEQSPEGELEDTIKEADEKLYIGKEKGRNIIIF